MYRDTRGRIQRRSHFPVDGTDAAKHLDAGELYRPATLHILCYCFLVQLLCLLQPFSYTYSLFYTPPPPLPFFLPLFVESAFVLPQILFLYMRPYQRLRFYFRIALNLTAVPFYLSLFLLHYTYHLSSSPFLSVVFLLNASLFHLSTNSHEYQGSTRPT